MAEPVRTLRGIITEPDGTSIEVTAEVFPPEQTEDGVWFCRVRFPAVLESEKRIAGVDRAQAIELSEMFLREMADHGGVELEPRAPPPA